MKTLLKLHVLYSLSKLSAGANLHRLVYNMLIDIKFITQAK